MGIQAEQLLGYRVGFRKYNPHSDFIDPYEYKTVETSSIMSTVGTLGHPDNAQVSFIWDKPLQPLTRYGVVVQAFNSAGSGPYSDEVFITSSTSSIFLIKGNQLK